MKKLFFICLLLITVAASAQNKKPDQQKESAAIVFTDSTVAFSLKDFYTFFDVIGNNLKMPDGHTIVLTANEHQYLYLVFLELMKPHIARWKQQNSK